MVPLVFDGSLNGDIFKEYTAKCLAPTLKEGDIVIMDNKVAGVIDPIIAVLYLPPYSPDFNPIEMMWSENEDVSEKSKSKNKNVIGSGNSRSIE